ncbi:MAG: outer membrane lipoprotein LolB [Sideroxydans sp.]|nr:outer membrane lipoprotein LolB [Sideroxydans sp.]
MRALLLLLVLLTGCATQKPVAVQRMPQADTPFTFSGRIALKQGSSRDGTGIRWAHDDADEILLLGPLGYTAARIYSDAHGATLEDAYGKKYSGADAESLMEKAAGWSLPLTGLSYWIKAVPAPQGESAIERNADGQINLIEQQGWTLRYLRFNSKQANALPLQILMLREGVEVTVVIDEWQVP